MAADSSLIRHLSELRRRIFYVLGLFVLTLASSFALVRPLLNYVQNAHTPAGVIWNAFSPFDALQLYVQTAVMIGIACTVPFLLLQLWLFVKPGLTEKERKNVPWLIPASLLLFVTGLAFSWYIVFPVAVAFAASVTTSMGLEETYGAAQYFQFLLHIILPLSLLFEWPVVVVFLARIGLLTPDRLRKIRKGAYVLLVVLSTLVTPPDFLSAFVVLIPLLLLYESSFPIARWAAPKSVE